MNVGKAGRGKDLVTMDEIKITNFTTPQSGHGIAAEYRGIWFVKIYTPPGPALRQERGRFCCSELSYLMKAHTSNTIVGVDFNCALNKTDSTAQFNYRRTLEELVHGFQLQDTWQAETPRNVFTHHSPVGVSRIEQIYTTKEPSAKKYGVDCGGSLHRPDNSDTEVIRRCPYSTTGQGILKNERLFP